MQKTTSFFLSYVFATVKSILVFVLRSLYTYNCIPQFLLCKFYTQACRQTTRLTYEINLFNNNLNNFNNFLTILKSYVDLNFEFNITVDSCMNSNFYVVDFYSLPQFTRLNIFKAETPESRSLNISPDPLFLCLLFFLNVFLCIFKEWAQK